MEYERKSGVNPLDDFEAREVFEWPKPLSCWFEEKDGGPRIIRTEHWPWFAVRPLEDPDFFLSFARLATRGGPDEKRIKRWVLEYGLPTFERDDTWGKGPEKASLPVKSFEQQVSLASLLLDLYTEIDHRNLAAIKARMTDPQTPHERDIAEKLANAFRSPDYRRHQMAFVQVRIWSKDELDLFLCRRVLAATLTEQVPEVRLRLAPESPYGMYESYHCPDLLAALYLQLYLLVLQGHPMRYCERGNCRTPFPRSGKKKYCNPTCRSAARHQD